MTTPWYDVPSLHPVECAGNYFSRKSITRFTRPPRPSRFYAASWFSVDDVHEVGQMAHVVAEMDHERVVYVVHDHPVIGLSRAVADMWQITEAVHRTNVLAASPRTHERQVQGIMSWFVDRTQLQDAVAPAFDNQEMLERRGKHPDFPLLYPPITPLEDPIEIKGAARHLQGLFWTGLMRIHTLHQDLMRDICSWPAVPSEASVGALCVLASGIAQMYEPKKKKRVWVTPTPHVGWAT